MDLLKTQMNVKDKIKDFIFNVNEREWKSPPLFLWNSLTLSLVKLVSKNKLFENVIRK